MPIVPALMKHVVIPSVGAAAIGGGIAATGPALDLVTGRSGRKAMDAIGASQAGKLSTEDYNIGLDQQFLNLFRPETDKVTTENITTRKDTRRRDAIDNDADLQRMAQRAGINLSNETGTVADIKAKHGKTFSRNDLEDEITFRTQLQESSPATKRAVSAAEEARQYRYFTDAENRRRDDLARLDRRADSQANLDYRMADLSARKQIAQDNYNLQVQKMNRDMKNDKKARIAQALAGLGSLGMMFAI